MTDTKGTDRPEYVKPERPWQAPPSKPTVAELEKENKRLTADLEAMRVMLTEARGSDRTLDRVSARTPDAQLWHDVAESIEIIDRVFPMAQHLLNRMRDNHPGQPGAQAYDPDSAGSTSTKTAPWCFVHETDHVTFNADGVKEYGHCAHTVQVEAPSDPVGNAVAMNNDRADADVIEFIREFGYLRDAGRKLGRIAERWAPPVVADEETRKAVILANKTACEECAKHGADREVYRTGDVNGNLDKPARLCSWHYTYVRDTGTMATHAQTAAHLANKRVYRPAS